MSFLGARRCKEDYHASFIATARKFDSCWLFSAVQAVGGDNSVESDEKRPPDNGEDNDALGSDGHGNHMIYGACNLDDDCVSGFARIEPSFAAISTIAYSSDAPYISGPKERHAMAMDANEIERLIRTAIPDAEVLIRDLAGDGNHYAATVISATFRGKSRVQQHQMVYDALGDRMGGVLHALALTTAAPRG